MRFSVRSALSVFAATALLAVAAPVPAVAQQDYGNPPGRAAQLSYLQGSVSLEPAGTKEWTAAVLNRPITNGDRIWDDEHSRAELDIGDAVVRLGSMTGFSFLNLDENTAQMQLTAGTAIVHVRSLGSGESDEVDTPNLALTLEQPGTYRVDVSQSGDATVVEVIAGKATASGGGQSYPVAAQQAVTFMGTTELTAEYETLGAPDAFDDWSMARDRQEAQQVAASQQYVAPGTVGAEDLGQYGTWQYTPEWGYAWFPTAVAPGWAPYSFGSWIWVSPWGWTWDDDEPWGFAPFHYGRWGYWHHSWCWVPGPRFARPVYAPALVGWVGGAALGAGARIGWFPLGPGDVYVPPYHVSPTYVQQVNVSNSRIIHPRRIDEIYRQRVAHPRFANSGVPGAVTAVSREVFTSARPVRPHRLSLPRHVLTRSRPTAVAPAVVPGRASVLGPGAGRIARRPPRALVDRPVVARLTPPRGPVPFSREVTAIRANGGRPLPITELARLRPSVPAAPVRLAHPGVAAQRNLRPRSGRPAEPFRGAPGSNRAAAPAQSISGRERALEHRPSPPARTLRIDRPPWAQRRPSQGRSYQPRAVEPRAAPPPRIAPHTSRPPVREAPAPAPRAAPPPRIAPHISRPPVREAPPPAPRAAPPPRAEPRGKPPQALFGAAGRTPAPPLYRTRGPIRYDSPVVPARLPASAAPAYPAPVYRAPVYRAPAYHPPASPPPMYHPVRSHVFQARPAPMPRAAPPPRVMIAHRGGEIPR